VCLVRVSPVRASLALRDLAVALTLP
jgi:hypothetical protein